MGNDLAEIWGNVQLKSGSTDYAENSSPSGPKDVPTIACEVLSLTNRLVQRLLGLYKLNRYFKTFSNVVFFISWSGKGFCHLGLHISILHNSLCIPAVKVLEANHMLTTWRTCLFFNFILTSSVKTRFYQLISGPEGPSRFKELREAHRKDPALAQSETDFMVPSCDQTT